MERNGNLRNRWKAMEIYWTIHGDPWKCRETYRNRWRSIDIHGTIYASTWKSIEINRKLRMEIHGKYGTIDGNSWKCVENHANPFKLWKSIEICRSRWKSIEIHGNQWNSIEPSIEICWNPSKYCRPTVSWWEMSGWEVGEKCSSHMGLVGVKWVDSMGEVGVKAEWNMSKVSVK